MKKTLTLLFLCITLLSNATTYYIDPAGNDLTGNGTFALPWKTLSKATTAVTTAGDIIHVNAGTYVETAMSTLAPGVSIEGDGITSIFKNSRTTNFSTPGSAFQNLLLASSEGTNGNQHIRNVKFDGQNINYWGVYVAGRSNVEIDHCTFIDFVDRGAIIGGRNDNANGAPTIYATGNSFHDNIMTNCAQYDQSLNYGAGCLNIGGQTGMLIYNNTITQNSRACGFNGWPIKYYNDGYLNGLKIYNNTLNKVLNCNVLGANNWDFAIELFHETGLEIYNNTLNGGSVDINYTNPGTYSFGAYIHDNTITMPSLNTYLQTGVTIEYESDGVIVENNKIDKVNVGVLFTPREGNYVKNINIRKNLITGVGIGEGTGFLINLGVYSAANITYDKINIYNNTLIIDAAHPPYFGIKLPNTTSAPIKNINIKNNIIMNAYTAPFVQLGGTTAIDSLNITYNDIFGNGNSNNLLLETPAPAPTHYTFSNNLNISPLFGTNYKLQAGGALVAAGIDVGLPYPGAAPSIGYNDTTAPAPPVVCGAMDDTKMGPGLSLDATKKIITKAGGFNGSVVGQQGFSSGKVYFRYIINSLPSPNWGIMLGIGNSSVSPSADPGSTVNEYLISGQGILYHTGYFNDTYTALNTFASNDTLGFAIDMAAGTIIIDKNRIPLGTAFTGLPAGTWYPMIGGHDFAWSATADFSPTYVPAGYTALCTGNAAPTASAGSNQIITLPTSSVTLSGSGTDTDGYISSYAWTKLSGGAATIGTPASATTNVTGMVTGSYVFQLTVTDDQGATGTATTTVTVLPAVVNIKYKRKLKM